MTHDQTVIGYCDPLTARPGETVAFKVSTETEAPYQADLVRLRNADTLTDANRFCERSIAAAFAGEYEGSKQPIYTGSFIEVADEALAVLANSFSVSLYFQPTTAHKGRQYLLSRWNQTTQQGWAVILNEKGCPALLLGDSQGNSLELSTHMLATNGIWTYVTISFDSETQQCQIFTSQATKTGNTLLDWPLRRSLTVPETFTPTQSGPIRIGAAHDGLGNGVRARPTGCFNGKIERPRIFSGVPKQQGYRTQGDELVALGTVHLGPDQTERLLADWDFSEGIGSTRIIDKGPYGLHGETVNLPLRAVAGVEWNGDCTNWVDNPSHYGAVQFHDDDLYDAEWRTDFTYQIPDDLPSGLYAARLTHQQSTDHICFFVAPKRGTATSNIALLMPTTSYIAYANHTLNIAWNDRFPMVHTSPKDSDYLERHPEVGRSTYCYHSDQSEVNYASRLRPMVHHRPGGQAYNFVADTDIIDWLEHEEIPFDIITDDLLHDEGLELLSNYRVVMTGSHPEYVTKKMLDAVETYTQTGGRLMYMGANGFFWVTSHHQELPGVIEVRRLMPDGESFHEFDGVSGSLWALNDRAPQKLLGVGFVAMAFFGPSYYEREKNLDEEKTGFIFEGVTDDIIGNFGNHFGGAVGEEIDRTDPQMGTPNDTIVLARCATLPGILEPDDFYTVDDVYAEMTFRSISGGGAVFSTGSIAWSSALNHNNFENNVAAVTRNVLRRFNDSAPF